MAKIRDKIRSIFRGKQNHILKTGSTIPFDFELSRFKFGECIYFNIVEILIDLASEVIWTPVTEANNTPKFRSWKRFVEREGREVLLEIFKRKGYAVIAYKKNEITDMWEFWKLNDNEYEEVTNSDSTLIQVKDSSLQYYVIKSQTLQTLGKSDYELCFPYIKYIDSIMNGSNSVTERMGVLVTASPKDPADAPIATDLSPDEKKELEEQIQREYGSLRNQKLIMLLPRPMEFQTINLAGLDQKINDKIKIAILAIADRIKVPANQIALIDAANNNSLSNGGELREGDLSKYRTFRRLINNTLFNFAEEIGLSVDYTLENEPKTVNGESIETK